MPFLLFTWSTTVLLAVLIIVLSVFYECARRRKVTGHIADIFEEKRLYGENDNADIKSKASVQGLPMDRIPGPEPTPGLGNLPEIAASGSYFAFLTNLHQQYGSIAKFFVGEKLLVSLADPELFRKTARTSNRPAELFEAFSPLMTKDSLCFMNGPEGRRRHVTFEAGLSHKFLPNYVEGIQQVADELLDRWKQLGDGSTVSVKEYTQPLAMKCILQQFFGEYFYVHNELVVPMQENFDYCWQELEQRSVGNVPEEDSDRNKEFIRRRDEIFNIVEATAEDRRANPPEPGDEKLIDIVLNYFGDDKVTIKAELVNLLVGAYLSTADILTWLLYFASKYQDAQGKLYNEIQDILGEEKMSFESLPQLKYLKNFVDESLRVSLLGTFVARESERDMILGGYQIPPGVTLVQAMGVVHMDPRFFPDPKRFNPERFSEENSKLRPGYAFVPFGFAGGRKCPGYRFAYLACMDFLSNIIMDYKISVKPGQDEPEIVHGVISTLKGDVNIVIEQRTKH